MAKLRPRTAKKGLVIFLIQAKDRSKNAFTTNEFAEKLKKFISEAEVNFWSLKVYNWGPRLDNALNASCRTDKKTFEKVFAVRLRYFQGGYWQTSRKPKVPRKLRGFTDYVKIAPSQTLPEQDWDSD